MMTLHSVPSENVMNLKVSVPLCELIMNLMDIGQNLD